MKMNRLLKTTKYVRTISFQFLRLCLCILSVCLFTRAMNRNLAAESGTVNALAAQNEQLILV